MVNHKSVKLVIDGRQWKAVLLSDSDFNSCFEPSWRAVTGPEDRLIFFRSSDLCESNVIHELWHARYSTLDTQGLDSEEIEEVVAEYMGEHGPALIDEGRRLFKRLKRLNNR
jgi:hypothetical protein